VWQRREPVQELFELIAIVQDLSAFVMSMDAKLELIIELLGGEDGEEGSGADS